MKYLLLLAFLAAVWWVWSKRQGAGVPESSTRISPAPENMVTCVHCGVHLPESEAVTEMGRVYCCEAHRSAATSVGR